MRWNLLFILLYTGWSPVLAQDYWQQKVDTKIEVSLDDQQNMLRGFITINYVNHSPDTLHYLYFHLWPNAYSNDHTPFAEQQYKAHKTRFYYASAADRGFIDSIQFNINGNEAVYFYNEKSPDIARVNLLHPLVPGDSLSISTPFRVKLPKVFSRMGYKDQAYFVSQWFPKPAVYDRKGWHPLSYLDQGEFYSEFGSYDVIIHLPEEYVVIATGNLQTPAEIQWLDSLARIPLTKKDSSAVHLPKKKEKKENPQTTSTFSTTSAMKTVRYTEDHIHDFAWFADKRWIVRKETVGTTPSGDSIVSWVAFLPGYATQWTKGNQYLREVIKDFGNRVGAYPYQTIKIVQGSLSAGGGMEYPTIAVIDKENGNLEVIAHEAGHNWFYGILGSNERDHPWMDEGLNTFYEQKIVENHHSQNNDTSSKESKKTVGTNTALASRAILYQLAATNNDQAANLSSEEYRSLNYGLDVYYKTALLFGWLESYMDSSHFNAGMRHYFEKWRFKHPYPEDLQQALQANTDKPLDWFFDQALTTKSLIDFSINSVRTTPEGWKVVVENKTSLRLPVKINAYNGEHYLGSAEAAPFSGTTTLHLPEEADAWTQIRIDSCIPDGRTANNIYRRNGIFHRSGVSFRPLTGYNLSDHRKIYIAPAAGFNVYDGVEGGILLHNLGWPESRLKFAFAPLYGFRSHQFAGAGSISYSWFPQNVFKEVFLQVDGKTFNYREAGTLTSLLFARYYKLAPSLHFIRQQKEATAPVQQEWTIKGYGIREENFEYHLDISDSLYKPERVAENHFYGLIRYEHRNDRVFNPFRYKIEGHIGDGFAKVGITGELKINYHTPKKGLYIRAFGGKFFEFSNDNLLERYYLNSTYTGMSDYLYDATYFGRNETSGFAARQVSVQEGGMKIPTFTYLSTYGIGRSNDWLASLNLKTDLPLKNIPIRLFLDVATFSDATRQNPSGNRFLFDGGVELYFMDVLQIYIPLVRSQDYNDYRKSITGKTSFLDGVTFSLNLDQFNWLRMPSVLLSQL